MSEKSKVSPEEIAETLDHYEATTIPIHVDVDVKHTVVELSEAEALLRSAETVALGDCACRSKEDSCGRPVNVCLVLDRTEEELKKESPSFKFVTVERALEALKTSHEAGLVHLAFRRSGGEITEFCSCCECCCWFLGKLKQFDYHDGVVESSHVARHLPDPCVACGLCVEKCPFDAWTTEADGAKPSLNASQCFGCGVCVTACPANAIAFEKRVRAS